MTVQLFVVLAASFVAVFLFSIALVGRHDRAQREQRLRKQVQATALAEAGGGDDDEERSWFRTKAGQLGSRLAEREGWSQSLDRRLERAAWALRPSEFIGITMMAGLGGVLLGGLLAKSLFWGIVLGALLALAPTVRMRIAGRKRSAAMQEQLADILMILAGSLRAGHSFLQALDSVVQEISEPAAHEFRRVVAEIRLGRPSTDAMNDLAARVESEDFNWAVMAVNIQRDIGGNLAEVLDTVAGTMRERERVRGQIKVLSAEGRLSMRILLGLPFAVAIYLVLVRPEYVGLLWTTRVGLVMVTAAASLMLLGVFWMRKVVRIDV